MRRMLAVTSEAPSIVVVRGASEKFCAPSEERETTNDDHRPVGCVFTVEPRVVLLTPQDVGEWLKFQLLAAEWRIQRGVMSSITEAALCPAYQAIIGMGETAVPYMLAELKAQADEPDQWFWALKAITCADPVEDQDRGDFVAMANAWLQWGQRNAYAW